ncbi:MAG: hypothetical protein AB7O24_31225 [Kofleriaceae bacterium]
MTQPAIATPVPVQPRAPRPARRWLRWIARTGMVIGGLAVGLIVAELVFRARADGAFPHLNIYAADPELGVRLMPGASQRVSFGGNPVTEVRINSAGYRGAELPAPASDEVLVVGDSQVFGLGVEEHQTFSAVMAKASGKPVVNGGVPTYGPAEYRAVIAEQLTQRHPKTVVLTINLVNDLFEVQRPNKDRHAVWDGWAVRRETAPSSTIWFPGRDFVYRRSHLFFALRKWRNAGEQLDERGVPSEGTWKDIVSTGETISKERLAIDQARHQRLQDVTTAHQQLETAEQALDAKIESLLGDREGADSFTLASARANPGDIVSEDEDAESGRSVIVTAEHIAAAARVRAKLRKELENWANAHATGDAKEALASFEARDQALAKLTKLDVEKLQAALDPPLGAYIRDVKQLVEAGGARLVVLILPIDVQVSADEWKKYGATPIDMEPSKVLTKELVELCRTLGLSALDATPVLASAEPGAFLDKDIHMTPKGHAAVAAALAKTLAEAPPAPVVASDRSPLPVPDVYREAPEIVVKGSTDAACETKQVREWLRVRCARTEQAYPVSVEIEKDDGNQTLVMQMPLELTLMIPIVKGRELVATLGWTDKTRVLRVSWPDGAAKPTMAFDKPIKRTKPIAAPTYQDRMTFRSPVERAVCDCWQTVFGGERYNARDEVFTCPGAYGAPDQACVDRYYRSTAMCPELLACIRRDPASPP